MKPDTIINRFTRTDGSYVFARWGRPIVPAVFGVQDETLAVIKGAIETVVAISGHKMAMADLQTAGNFLIFFFADWSELLDVPTMGDMIPDLPAKVAQLNAAGANQYRSFRFDEQGAISAVFSFVRVSDAVADTPLEALSLDLAARAILLWGEGAFAHVLPVVDQGQGPIIDPDLANLIRAAYAPNMPDAARDPSHGLRLAARVMAAG